MIYAKSKPKETLREHTDGLLRELDNLKNSYGNKIESLLSSNDNITIDKDEFWRLLDIISEFHDLGKVYTPFQNVIREKIGEEKLITNFENDIYHNYISPAFINYKELNIPKNLKSVVAQSIGYHHERDVIIDKDFKDKVKKVLDEDILNKVNDIEESFKPRYFIKTNSLKNGYLKYMEKRIKPEDDNYNLYILLKGLTHRLDYAASAHEAIELNYDKNVGEYTEKFIKDNGFELKDVQKFAKKNREKNIILKASTGMGKTETALIWIDNDKGFFTLPLRVSINALFDRVSKEDIKYDYAGLLHSTSLDYMQENDYSDYEERVNQSKLMSTKLTFSTIDQIFKFPFKYRGYEKEYATLAYSKVVIDEIQAYSPEICAVLIKGIEMIHKIGGKFMIMTATMPTIYLDELRKRGVLDDENTLEAKFNTDKKRHNIKLEYDNINNNLEKIINEGYSKKVLVIVNTVNAANETYEKIKEMDDNVNLNLLHSMYIQEDRSKLEHDIKVFARGNENGIWITTQLVEASLDVDFDILHTELSTLDSLFQRFGRCNRKGEKDIGNPNVFIYTEDANGIGSIYDKDIVEKGKNLLKDLIENQGVDGSLKISEDDKVCMIEKLYSKESLEGTDFYKKFEKSMNILDSMISYNLSKNEAQSILRDIDSNTVIPKGIYRQIENTYIRVYEDLGELLTKEYSKDKKDEKFIQYLKSQRKLLRREIMKKTVNVPTYKTRELGVLEPINKKGLEDIKILNYDYEVNDVNGKLEGRGVLIGKELANFI